MSRVQKTIGILTGGGDCPGLNAAIRAIALKALEADYEVRGFLRGWEGILTCSYKRLTKADVMDILGVGGTILGSSRTNPFKDAATARRFQQSLKQLKLHALIVLGGDDTLGVAAQLAKQKYPVIGVPKTIDNDLVGTDTTIGFNTAVAIATEAIDRLRTTAVSHDRIVVVEVMGRHAGWIALESGLAGGADVILIPEQPFTFDAVIERLRTRRHRGRKFAMIVVAEGAQLKKGRRQEIVVSHEEKDAFGHVRLGGIGQYLASEIEGRTGWDVRAVVLGHLQRGGSPTAVDRILATRYGIRAMELVGRGKWGRLVALQNGKITDVALTVVSKGIKAVDKKTYRVAVGL